MGVETRIHFLRTPLFAAFFITIGLLLPLAGLVSLFLRRNKLVGVLAVIAGSLNSLIPPADQAKFFFTVPPPPLVSLGEYLLIFVGILYLLYGSRVYSQKPLVPESANMKPENASHPEAHA